MRMHLPRPARLGLAVAVGVALGLSACSDAAPAAPAEPPATPGTPLVPPSGSAGSDGLTVRYLQDGTVKTLRVEDFPR